VKSVENTPILPKSFGKKSPKLLRNYFENKNAKVFLGGAAVAQR
jgi:hypothetical protein